MAVEVIKDLDRLDMADSTIVLLNLQLDNMVEQISIQDRVMLGQQEQINNLNEIIRHKDIVDENKVRELKYWKKEVKRQKRQKFLVAGIGMAAFLMLAIVN